MILFSSISVQSQLHHFLFIHYARTMKEKKVKYFPVAVERDQQNKQHSKKKKVEEKRENRKRHPILHR